MTIFNRYKDPLDNLIDNSNPKSPDRPKLIDEGSRNLLRSAGNSTGLLEGGCLNKDVSNCQSARRAPETRDFQLHKYCNVVPFDPMSKRKYYENGERGGED